MDIVVVAKAIVVNDGKILLLRRSETDERRPLEWDVPGGHTDPGEFIEEAVVRETMEEAGLTIDPKQLKLVYTMTEPAKEGLSGNWLFFVAPTNQTDVKISNEHVEYAWVELEKALEYITYDRQNKALRYIAENDLL